MVYHRVPTNHCSRMQTFDKAVNRPSSMRPLYALCRYQKFSAEWLLRLKVRCIACKECVSASTELRLLEDAVCTQDMMPQTQLHHHSLVGRMRKAGPTVWLRL